MKSIFNFDSYMYLLRYKDIILRKDLREDFKELKDELSNLQSKL